MGHVTEIITSSWREWASSLVRLLPVACGVMFCAAASAAPPRLYANPSYEGPVRAEPDELLMLAGSDLAADDTVIYQASGDGIAPAKPPGNLGEQPTAEAGAVPIVSAAGAPYWVMIRWPTSIRPDQTYALWVRTPAGEVSTPVLVNDTRPLWVTPAFAFSTATIASLPRYVKVVGRNLQGAAGAATQIRLEGPQSVTLSATGAPEASRELDHYVARADLPVRLAPGQYRVSVSRDGKHWITVRDQSFTVMPDPTARRRFELSDESFGNCRPDDGRDDTACFTRAIAAAKAAGGGIVAIGKGTWDLFDDTVPSDGIPLSEGVDLIGAGQQDTIIARHTRAQDGALFSLRGRNTVSDITFRDVQSHRPDEPASPTLRLGPRYWRIAANDPIASRGVEDVVITRNVFDRPFYAIADGGLPIRRLFITYNVIGAYELGIALSGNRYNTTQRYGIEDSVIAYNELMPGSYMRPDIAQGSFASELGASHRLDFSGNRAEGSVKRFLNAGDPSSGWRAGFFFMLNDSQEMTLIAQNTVQCPGDRIGDGEAIAWDANGDTAPFPSAATVREATANSVTVEGVLASRQNERDVDVGRYYVGHWVRISEGAGVGQVRRIVSYTAEPHTSRVTFTVAPDWDVAPAPGVSRLTVNRSFRHVYALDNVVDQRSSLCTKGNRTTRKGGVIAVWAPTSSSVVAGNRQFDTDGIHVQHNYTAVGDPKCPECIQPGLQSSYFLEIRDNTIEGEYDWGSDCSRSGIQIGFGASPTPSSPPPVTGFGISIARNTVRHADGVSGGAIGAAPMWFEGPPAQRWRTIQGLSIQHNTIADVSGPPAAASCGPKRSTRHGIDLESARLVYGTVLYGNACSGVTTPFVKGGRDTSVLCPDRATSSCDCTR